MADRSFSLQPQDVPTVNTKYRRIQTQIPVPESIPILEDLRRYEPRSMSGQPPIVWDRAEGVQVYDRWGNMWLDFSSGVLVTSAGHSHPTVVEAIVAQAQHHLLHNYCFPSAQRASLAKRLVELSPAEHEKCFLLTTGSEATECCIKLMRTHGISVGGPRKSVIVGFENAFHGRTMGAQLAGGMPRLKEWIGIAESGMAQVPYPDGFRCTDTSFDFFLSRLQALGIGPDRIAGVITETYQGVNAAFAPPEYFQAMRTWADEHDILITMDEIQAGFGRCGTLFGYEHYGIVPDLVACGKGIADGLPLSAVIGTAKVMDQYPPGSMTSTHTGNPICVVAALASLEAILSEGMIQNAATIGAAMLEAIRSLKAKYPQAIGEVNGKGLVVAVQFTHPGTTDPNPDLASAVTRKLVEKGVMVFAPVGVGGCAIKYNPPLCITEEAMLEGVTVLDEAIGELV